MHQLSLCFLALVMSLGTVEGGGILNYIYIGFCPSMIGMSYIITDSFMGTWYEYGTFKDQFLTGCTKVTYTLHPHGQLIDVEKESVTLFFKSSIKGQMKRADPAKNDTKFTINWLEDIFEGRENDVTPVNYQVLSTDYTRYAIIFNCVYLNFFVYLVELYVYTRDREPSDATIYQIEGTLGHYGLGSSPLIRTNQRHCYN